MLIFLNAVFLVVVGELGDKTQLLTLALAGKYKVRYVLSGVVIASLLNHGLAVIVGSYLGNVLPMRAISLAAGLSFLAFGLWTLRGEGDEEKNLHKEKRFGPIIAVAVAFFLAEMGDKTQLMAVALAAEYRYPLLVLAGTVTGMLVANSIGVFCGAWICKHIPEKYIKWVSGLVFMLFGSLTLFNLAPEWLLAPLYIIIYLLVITALIYLCGVRFATPAEQPCEKAAAIDLE
ncbi:MAG: TMEM165/GDT1 family protein [Anaerolineae bacterium]|nr:TMEM165/GDT1 family protein [Anaerolineae bacterium]